MRDKRIERGEGVKKVMFAGDGDEEGKEMSDDSEDLMYDSEEEAEAEQQAFLEKFEAEKLLKKAKEDESKEEQIETGYDIGKELA